VCLKWWRRRVRRRCRSADLSDFPIVNSRLKIEEVGNFSIIESPGISDA
jgi:hypothetical protein